MAPCKLWTGVIATNGYGRIERDGKQQQVHRWAWTQENGPIPEGMVIHHTCGNRLCYEITHLEMLTWAEHSDKHHGTTCRNCGQADWFYEQRGKYRIRHCRPCEIKRNRHRAR